MPRAIVMRTPGPADVLHLEDVEVGDPGPGQVRIRQTAVGVNFHDIYVRSGLYTTLPLPGIPGVEAAGVVDALGDGVAGLAVGDRVGYITDGYGAYTGARLLDAALAMRLPDSLGDVAAASVLIKGITVEVLLRRVHAVKPGDWILVQAAAGGVGQLLVRWASSIGATVIGTVGSEAKAEIARSAGAAHTILYRDQDVASEVQRITDGRGVDVVYDSVGGDTFDGSLGSLAMLGHLVNFGQSSGPVPPFAVARLSPRSASLTRPMVFHYLADPALRAEMAASLFAALADGTVTAEPARTFPLAEAAAAHAAMESRAVAGAIVLVPDDIDRM
ncbi:MAG: quinone oxidoreductase [Chloroflexota bacterium]